MKAIENQIEIETQKVIDQNKEESVSLANTSKQEIATLQKQFKNKVAELKEEKDKIMEEMVKMKAEKDIEREKVESTSRKAKIEKNLKLFNVLVENGHELTELPIPEENDTNDECIESIRCEGNCEKVSQMKRLNSLKKLGNSRSCPQSKSENKTMYKCDKCDFISQNKVYFTSHMKSHIEKKIESNFPTKKPCHYFRSRNGCKKGDTCDYDHSEAAQAKPVVKVPKLCQNGEACVWAPRCRYVHPENGEVLPAGNVERGSRTNVQRTNFGAQDIGQQPPGWSNIPPPAVCPAPPTSPAPVSHLLQGEQERRNKVIQEFLQLIVPNLMCMTTFPSLEKNQTQRK